MLEVRPERTGWRCEKISRRHRDWGYNCPAVDLDFVVAEYNHGKPVAIIEYKDRHAKPPDITHPTYTALICLADYFRDGPLPCLIATYDSEDWWVVVQPLNGAARAHYVHVPPGQALTEQRFVRSLYLLRKTALEAADEKAINKLKNVLPSDGPSVPT